jgi:hypothetical protein
MKLIITLGISILFFGASFAQQVDSRLLERYSDIQLESMQQENPQEFALQMYALDNAVYFSEVPKGKTSGLQKISLTSATPTHISLGLEIEDENQYFLVDGEDRMLVIKSRWVLNSEMKKK